MIDILKLLECTIQNSNKINKSLVSLPYFYSDDEQMLVQSNTKEFISKIINRNSKLIEETIKEEVILTNDSETIIAWSNNEFVFKMNLEKFKPENPYREMLKDQLNVPDFSYFIKYV